MGEHKFKTALKQITNLLNSPLEYEDGFQDILKSIKTIIDFDYAALYYINSSRINLKSSLNFMEQDLYLGERMFFDVSDKFCSELYDRKSLTFTNKSPFAKEIELAKKPADFMIAKLMIRDTAFGFIMLAKFGAKKFSKDDLELLEAFSSVASYSIKDSELSSVFKLQLRALQESIIEKTQAYKTIEEQNKKILEADKIKNDFLANISHELRTPLNAIIGFSDVLGSEIFGALNDKQKEYITDINSSGVHLLGMINEILEISRIESKALTLNKKNFCVKDAVGEVVNMISSLSHKKQLKITIKIDEKLTISADYQKFQQILFNLVSNAIKFSHIKGEILITVEKKAKRAILKIKDSGVGIDKKYQGKIFGKFVQLNNIYTKNESSTGLGLTITKELVELHGGKIYIESALKKGSTFIVELPL